MGQARAITLFYLWSTYRATLKKSPASDISSVMTSTRSKGPGQTGLQTDIETLD